jgi:hypothetical protein
MALSLYLIANGFHLLAFPWQLSTTRPTSTHPYAVTITPQQTIHSLIYTRDTPRVPAVFETCSSHTIGYESLSSKYVYCVLYRAVCRLDITRIGHETERKAGSVCRGSEHRGTQKQTSQRFASGLQVRGKRWCT